ncbi:MAG: HD domain-containing protein [Candidatus Pacebacteria bacterium]|nr:HD domain-containing protein [Candidatus Paceibacterota bacterium]
MNVIEEIKIFVENECKKPSSKYGYDPFLYHFIPMVEYAEKLSDELGGDKEIIMIASWLHDIGAIIYGRKDHHITGAQIAEEKLKELKYPIERIELVKKCILNHRGSQKNNAESIEEHIVAEADIMSNFDNIGGIFKAAFVYEGKDQGQARDSVREKLENKWKQLHFESSKKIIRPKYEAMKILLD